MWKECIHIRRHAGRTYAFTRGALITLSIKGDFLDGGALLIEIYHFVNFVAQEIAILISPPPPNTGALHIMCGEMIRLQDHSEPLKKTDGTATGKTQHSSSDRG